MNSSSFDRTLRQVLIVPIVAVLIGAAAIAWQTREANLTVDRIQQADNAIAESLLIERLIIDEETGLRGYQTTHDPRFLEPYSYASRTLPAEFARRRGLALNAERRAIVDRLQAYYNSWHDGFAEPVIATVRKGGDASDLQMNLQGKLQMDAMRLLLLDLTATPERNRATRVVDWRRQVRVGSEALILLALLVGIAIGFYTRRKLREVSDAFRQAAETLRLRAEEMFRSEQKLRATLQSIGEGVITCNAEGRIETMNDVAEHLTGWPCEEALTLPLDTVFNIVHQTTRQPMENPVSQVKRLNSVVAVAGQTILIRRDRSEIFVDESGAPIRDEAGVLTGVVLVFRDVTMALKSREALVANEKLAVAGRLAATIAHEIHNPLDAVSNLLYLMGEKSSPEENRRFLEMAQEEVARVTQISRAMLSLYRESKAPVPIDIADMLRSILLLMERRFSDLNVAVETDLPANLIVYGFPAELRQVFTNLLANAAEASAKEAGGDGPVHVVASANDPGALPNGSVREPGVTVTITDRGGGVPQEVVPKLFKPFFTTKGENGTGLGLWVSRGIITKHGGTIDLTSNTTPAAHGTTLTVFLATRPTISSVGE